MCFTHDDYVQVYSEEIRKARKPHRCEGCGQMITPGTLYVYGHGVFDGRGFSIFSCGVCRLHQQRISEIEESRGCRGSSWPQLDDLAEWLDEYTEFVPSTVEEGQAELSKRRQPKAVTT